MSFFKSYIKENFLLYAFVFVLYFAAAIIGIYWAMSAKEGYVSDITSYIQSVVGVKTAPLNVFKNGIASNFKYCLALCISASFIVFLPVCFFLIIFKGFSAGFASSFIIRLYGIKGLGVSLVSVVMPLFLSLPMWFIIYILSVQFSINTFKLRKKISSHERWKMYVSYMAKVLVLFAFISIVTLIEAFLSPYVFSPLK